MHEIDKAEANGESEELVAAGTSFTVWLRHERDVLESNTLKKPVIKGIYVNGEIWNIQKITLVGETSRSITTVQFAIDNSSQHTWQGNISNTYRPSYRGAGLLFANLGTCLLSIALKR